MDKFNCTLRGYDKEEVNAFIDKIIIQVEKMVKELEEKNKRISTYKESEKKYKELIESMTLEIEKLSKTQINTKEIIADEIIERAKIDSKVMIDSAKIKSKKIIEEAEEQADMIINECLLEAKKSEMQVNLLKQDIEILKQKKETLYYN